MGFYLVLTIGGCSVSLLTSDKLEQFLAILKRDYYQKRLNDMTMVDNYLFPTAPSVGACLFKLERE